MAKARERQSPDWRFAWRHAGECRSRAASPGGSPASL